MDVQEFCRLAMAEYERQWSEARGHQERHPLREKMRILSEMAEQTTQPERFRTALAAGCGGDDPIRALVCEDLLARWDRLSAAESGGAARGI
jgi:hypothetical protein